MRGGDYIFIRLSELKSVRDCFFFFGGGAKYLNGAFGLSVFNNHLSCFNILLNALYKC